MAQSEKTPASSEEKAEQDGATAASADAEEQKPKKATADEGNGDSSTAFVVAMGANLGKTTRVLGEGSKLLWKGSGGAIAKAARGVGASVKRLEEKRRQRAVGGDLLARSERIRGQITEAFQDIGQEVFQCASADSTSIEVNDKLREYLSKARGLQDELQNVEKAIKEKAEAAEAAGEEIEAQGETVQSSAETAEPGSKKKGKSKRASKAQTESEQAPAESEQEAAAGSGDEALAEEQAEGE